MHGAAVLGVHQLVGGVVAGDPVDVREIEEDEVGLVALGDPADAVAEAECAGAAGGGGLEDLLAGEPAAGVRSLGVGAVGGDPQGFVHVLVVAAGCAVGADADVELLLQHGLDRGDAVAEQHVAAGVVRHGGAVVGETRDVVVVEPHAMGGDEIRAEQAQVLQVRGRRLAVLLEADDDLDFGLVHMRVQPDAELAR